MFIYIPTRKSGDWSDLLAGLIIGAGLLGWCLLVIVGIVASAFR